MTAQYESPLRLAALAYAGHGLPVFPCKPRGKAPLAVHGFKDATTDAATVRAWWERWPQANIAIPTGKPTGWAVIDCDMRDDGTDGARVAQVLFGWGPVGPWQRTGGGGLQAICKRPDLPKVRSRSNVLEGIDLKVDGGYVIVPPSIHPSGNCYEWKVGLDDKPLPELPTWALDGQQQGGDSGEEGGVSAQNPPTDDAKILEGRRNVALTALAGSMRRAGMSQASIEAALLSENAARCEPPLPGDKVRGIAQSVARYEPAADRDEDRQLLRDCTDAGNAEVIARRSGDRLRYDHRLGRWLVWADHWWREDSDGEPVRLALQAARWRYRQAYDQLDGDVARGVAKWAIASRQDFRVRAALRLAQSTRPLADAGDGWDAAPWLLGVGNGVVDLHTGKLRDGRREDRLTMHSEVAFDPAARCPRWDRFIQEIFEGKSRDELVGFIRRTVGYSLTGSTQEQVFFILHGAGANGKGVLLETLRHVLGPYAYDSGFGAFEDTRGYAPHPEQLAELAGRRFVTASETKENSRLSAQRLKALSHGDTTSAAFKYGWRFEFTPQAKIWLALNRKPRVDDDSFGFWRSVRLIPFERQFLGDEADAELVHKLRAEGPGVLAWAVRGCLEWQWEGLGLPEAVVEATDAYEAESDPLGDFLHCECLTGPKYRATARALYQAYGIWAEQEGLRQREVWTRTAFGRQLGARFRKDRKTPGGVQTYYGIGLVRTPEAKS